MEIDTQTRLGVLRQRVASHRLTGLRLAQAYDVAPGRGRAKVMVERDDSMDLGARYVERARNLRERFRRHEADTVLYGVQNDQQRTGEVRMLREHLIDRRLMRPERLR